MASPLEAAIAALRAGQPCIILDARQREAECDMYFPAQNCSPANLRTLRVHAGGELYIAVGHEVAAAFGLPLAGEALAAAAAAHPTLARMAKATSHMCQGACSVGLSLDHRSTKTGAPDAERALTVARLAQLYGEVAGSQAGVAEAGEALGREFHAPGHIFLCQEHPRGLAGRQGHTELSVALAKAAGVPPLLVGCVMLCNEGDAYGPLPPEAAEAWAKREGVAFIEGPALIAALQAPAPAANGHAAAAAVAAANGNGCAH